jgi:hypothetical protein
MLCGGGILMAISHLRGESFHWPPQPLALGAWAYVTSTGIRGVRPFSFSRSSGRI